MGAILALLMALDILSGSKAIGQSGYNTYSLSSSRVSGYGENYSYNNQCVKDSMGRVVYKIRSSYIIDAAGKQVFSIFSGTLDGSDDYKVTGSGVYKNNKRIFSIH